MNDIIRKEVGDPFSTRSSGIAAWALNTLMSPPTDQFHFGLLWIELPDGDFVTIESKAPKGLQPGRLSWYDKNELTLYRVNCTEEIRHQAPFNALDYQYARGIYDYATILKFILSAGVAFSEIMIKEHKIRRLWSEDLHYVKNSLPYCIEVVLTGYDIGGFNIVPPGVAPTPNAMRQAEIEGKLVRYAE